MWKLIEKREYDNEIHVILGDKQSGGKLWAMLIITTKNSMVS